MQEQNGRMLPACHVTQLQQVSDGGGRCFLLFWQQNVNVATDAYKEAQPKWP
jgi:hypothetical protein